MNNPYKKMIVLPEEEYLRLKQQKMTVPIQKETTAAQHDDETYKHDDMMSHSPPTQAIIPSKFIKKVDLIKRTSPPPPVFEENSSIKKTTKKKKNKKKRNTKRQTVFDNVHKWMTIHD
jgi:hypothetical protein